MSALSFALMLAFQVWDVFGWAGQAVFTWRTLEQWISSERAKRSVAPTSSFWIWSLTGIVLLLVYQIYRRDPVFVLGSLVNGAIYARNLWMARRPASPVRRLRGRFSAWPVALGLAVFVFVAIEALGPDHGLIRFDLPFLWLAVGFVGQLFWSGRFVIQWYESERRGQSVLPASFFWVSLVGAALLFAYAAHVDPHHERDWVHMAAYGPNFIPYVRNLILMRRAGRADAKSASTAESPTGPTSA